MTMGEKGSATKSKYDTLPEKDCATNFWLFSMKDLSDEDTFTTIVLFVTAVIWGLPYIAACAIAYPFKYAFNLCSVYLGKIFKKWDTSIQHDQAKSDKNDKKVIISSPLAMLGPAVLAWAGYSSAFGVLHSFLISGASVTATLGVKIGGIIIAALGAFGVLGCLVAGGTAAIHIYKSLRTTLSDTEKPLLPSDPPQVPTSQQVHGSPPKKTETKAITTQKKSDANKRLHTSRRSPSPKKGGGDGGQD